ncbi:MAG: branched-chain amino acid ABC transporter substrate-binding protein [Rhodobacteraceae bacterium]|nr:branched-chain amino acid ABC transporter substrate-binding protein [Paracoccaceae bacterium]
MNKQFKVSKLAAFLMSAVIATAAQAEVVVGIAGPMTGGVAFLGEQQEIGARRAIDDINAAGGVLGETVTVMVVDDSCDAEQAEAAAQQLVSANVVFVNGHICSSTTIPASKIYEREGIIMMSPASTNPRVTDEGGSNVFRVIGRDDDQAVVAAELIMSEFAGQNLAVINGPNTYSTELAKGVVAELAKRGKTPNLVQAFEWGASSYDDVVDAMAGADISLVYLISNSPSDMGLIALQAREKLPDIQFLSGDALSGEDFLLVSGDAGVGTLFTFGPDPRLLPTAAEVTGAIRDEEFYEPSGYTLYSYAVMQAWAQAVEAAGTFDEKEVIKALQTDQFDTVIGRFGFDEKGDVTGIANFVIYEYGDETYSQRK